MSKKGGSSTSSAEIPRWLEDMARQSFGLTSHVGQMGYMPYYGPTVAAFNPTQEAAFQNNIDAASAFGMNAPSSPMQGLPAPQDFGNGIQGYSPLGLFQDAQSNWRNDMPGQAQHYDAMFINPYQTVGEQGVYTPDALPPVPEQSANPYRSDYEPGPMSAPQGIQQSPLVGGYAPQQSMLTTNPGGVASSTQSGGILDALEHQHALDDTEALRRRRLMASSMMGGGMF